MILVDDRSKIDYKILITEVLFENSTHILGVGVWQTAGITGGEPLLVNDEEEEGEPLLVNDGEVVEEPLLIDKKSQQVLNSDYSSWVVEE